MVIALGDLMRISINKDKDFITIGEELKYIEDYLTIQKIRYRDKFTVDINVEPELLNKRIPKLVVQPVVENAIVHGIEKKIGKGSLVIHGTTDSGFLFFKIIDDGIGMIETELGSLQKKLNAISFETTDSIDNANGIDQVNISDSSDYLKGHTGMGIINVNSRIKMLYGHQYGLSIDSKKGFGTVVTIFMPVPA
jgi:two-component system sensor histidine kinase YesM